MFGGRLGKMVKSGLGVVFHHSVGLEYKFGVLIWSIILEWDESSRMVAVLLLSCMYVR
jgi:hypothetical protein